VNFSLRRQLHQVSPRLYGHLERFVCGIMHEELYARGILAFALLRVCGRDLSFATTVLNFDPMNHYVNDTVAEPESGPRPR
jgi:hypothetical protein